MPETQGGRPLQVLDRQECFRLLATRQGAARGERRALPPDLPRELLAGPGDHRARTGAGTKMGAANHANVTFEVDEFDTSRRTGWSVLVRGLAEELTAAHGAAVVERTRTTALEPWAPGDYGHWLRLIPHKVTGRRIADAG